MKRQVILVLALTLLTGLAAAAEQATVPTDTAKDADGAAVLLAANRLSDAPAPEVAAKPVVDLLPCPATHPCPSTFCLAPDGGSSNCSRSVGSCSQTDSGLKACMQSNGTPLKCTGSKKVYSVTCPCACLGAACGTQVSVTCL